MPWAASVEVGGVMPSMALSSISTSVTAQAVPSGQPSLIAACRSVAKLFRLTISRATFWLVARMELPPIPMKVLSSIEMSLPRTMRIASMPTWLVPNRKPRIARKAASRSSSTLWLVPGYCSVAGLVVEAERIVIGAVAVPWAVTTQVFVYVPAANTTSSPGFAPFTTLHQASADVTLYDVGLRMIMLNEATQALSASAVSAASAQSACPLQPLNWEPAAGVATRTTFVPVG